MGIVKEPLPVKLLFSIISGKDNLIDSAIEFCNKVFGEIELVTSKFIFNHTKYYEKEMGDNLFRKFIVFEKLSKRDNIASVKLKTNEIEQNFIENGNRKVNIDPGYITLENFILFTTKNYTHRIYLQKGIYADLTLIFHKKKFNPLPWTYPDYASEEIRNFLLQIRNKYKEQLLKESYNE